MHAINRILGLVVVTTAWASCGWAGAQTIVGAGQKPVQVPPALGRRPVAVMNPSLPFHGAASRPTLQNSGPGQVHGNGHAPNTYLPSGQRQPVLVKPQPPLVSKHSAERRKKDETNLARLDQGKQKREGHWRRDESAGGGGRIYDPLVVGVGRKYFATDSHWVGKRYNGDAGREVRLDVIQLAGNAFGGVLSQRTNDGDWVKMEVEGEVEGKSIAFHTTRMLEGKNRHLNFDGYLTGNHITTDVSGRTWTGTEASGWMDLWRR